MTENLNASKIETSAFILKAALIKDSVFDAYQDLCEKYKNQKIDYVDFEWKYFQFYHGNWDLNIERSPDNSSQLTFCDLPMDVLENVVTKLDFLDSMALRKVSRNLRNLVESTEIHCKFMEIDFGGYFPSINIESQILSYDQSELFHGPACKISLERKWPLKTLKYSKKGSRDQLLIVDASKVLKNRNLKIDRLSLIGHKNEGTSTFLEFLKSLSFQLDVRSIYVPTCEGSIPILQFLKPGRLERIEFGIGFMTISQFSEIAKTEQWKKARELCCHPFLHEIRTENFLQFRKIEIFGLKFSHDNVIAIRELLFKSAHLESCTIKISHFVWRNNDGIDPLDDEEFDDKINRILSQNPLYNSETRRFSILSSDDYFQLENATRYYEEGAVFDLTIERVKKNR